MKKPFLLLIGALAVSGCADTFLRAGINQTENAADISLSSYQDFAELRFRDGYVGAYPGNPSLGSVGRFAWDMANAYARASRNAAVAQDVAAGGLILAAGWTAVGSVQGISEAQIARRATAGVAAQQYGQRGLAVDAINAVSLGATRMNCVATAAALFAAENSGQSGRPGLTGYEDRLSAQLTLLVMREIEFAVQSGFVHELPNFNDIVQIILASQPAAPGAARENDPQRTLIQSSRVSSYYAAVKTCPSLGEPSG